MDKLKPCPFCGEKSYLFVGDGVRVMCPKCRATSKSLVDSMINDKYPTHAVQSVIEAWNKRADDNILSRIRQELIDAGGCDASDDCSKGWDMAIDTAIRIVEKYVEVEEEE